MRSNDTDRAEQSVNCRTCEDSTSGRAIHIYLPPSPSSTIWYWLGVMHSTMARKLGLTAGLIERI